MDNFYWNIKGELVKYRMCSDYDTPKEREKSNMNLDIIMHECSMYECKFIFSGCNRKFKKQFDKKDNRKCTEYKHKNL